MAVRKRDNHSHLIGWALLVLLVFGLKGFGEDPAGKASSVRETLIRVSTEKEGPVTHLFVENVQSADVTVTFEMDLANLVASVKFPCTATLHGKTRKELFTLRPRDPDRGWSWTYTYYSTFGSTTVRHDDAFIYALPYAPGKSYRVSQGYNGEYSHFGADQFAMDWRMPVATPVYAARGGTVVGVKNDSNTGGDDSKFDWDANYILIQHSDGTLGQYVHLMKGGARVKVGQHVEAGDWIALSGNTGHSTGPHLHFSVFKALDGKHRMTIPVRYRTAEEFAVTLEEGRAYKAAGYTALGVAAKPRSSNLVSTDHPVPVRAAESEVAGARGGNAAGH